MKLWQKDIAPNELIEKFTIGNDPQFDILLAPFDVLGNIAHAKMLHAIHILTEQELSDMISVLIDIHNDIEKQSFQIDPTIEDIHSQIEFILTKKIGNTGKKIHTARSRNDQVLLDIHLFLRHQIEILVNNIQHLFELLQSLSNKHKDDLLPGYTHFQLAMPSSFGLWFGAYSESLTDDLLLLYNSFQMVNKNPLGSGAGYGSSFPINRTMTTELLGFDDMYINVVYAQMGRGRAERVIAQALSSIADTLSKLSMDMCLYMNQNFNFISFPAAYTTGSSIMPHKKNPDVFELIRSHCNRIKALPNEIYMMTSNLPSGYHRDFQLLKENLFPSFTTLNNCLSMTHLMLSNIQIKKNLLDNPQYVHLFSVEEVNKLVIKGVPFREAYQQIGQAIEKNTFTCSSTSLHHTHEGSIGNLCNEHIQKKMNDIIQAFSFKKIAQAYDALLRK